MKSLYIELPFNPLISLFQYNFLNFINIADFEWRPDMLL